MRRCLIGKKNQKFCTYFKDEGKNKTLYLISWVEVGSVLLGGQVTTGTSSTGGRGEDSRRRRNNIQFSDIKIDISSSCRGLQSLTDFLATCGPHLDKFKK